MLQAARSAMLDTGRSASSTGRARRAFDESGDVYRPGIFRVIDGNPYIRVYRDGVLEAATPDTPLVDGKVGFGSKSAAATFDDLVVY